MKTLFTVLIFSVCLTAQNFEVIKVTGDVKYQTNSEEKWLELKSGDMLNDNSVVLTDQNASVKIKSGNYFFSMKELSAVSVNNIKKLSRDELLLALAMEELINVPKQEEQTGSGNTAVYGSSEGNNPLFIKSDIFGIKRLNGAVQLAENGMEESAVLAAKETYRKYPDVKSLPAYRIFFANILSKKGLYEEALADCLEIQSLELSPKQRDEVELMMKDLEKKILSD